jgi:hypothetical protein
MARTGRTWLGAAVAAGAAATLWVGAPVRAQAPAGTPAAAKDGWRRDFDEACAKTQDAMVLTSDELRALVARCDKLKPIVDGLPESERKVYAKRLAGCRNLYAYVLEAREAGQAR